jgi:hypothetical protein
VCISSCWQHAHYAYARGRLEDHQAGALLCPPAPQHNINFPLEAAQGASCIISHIKPLFVLQMLTTLQVHGADGLKVLASKASSISRHGALLSFLFRDGSIGCDV